MCFFDQHRFSCGDWNWGHFRQHCNREYRTGKTCGLKIIMATYQVNQKCELCDKIDIKQRRRAEETDQISRWQREGSTIWSKSIFLGFIDQSYENIKTLDREICKLGLERETKKWLHGLESMVASTQLPLRGSSSVDEFVERSDKLTVKFAQVIAKDNKRKRRCKFVLRILVMPHTRFQRDLRRLLDEYARDLFQEIAAADVNAISNQKYRHKVLQAAACKGSSTVKEIMLAAGANINAIPAHDKGRTALQSAVERGNSAIVFQLLASQHGQRLATQAMKRHCRRLHTNVRLSVSTVISALCVHAWFHAFMQ